jgi:hypothetical protein
MSTLADDPERQPLLSPQQPNVESPEATGDVTSAIPNEDLPADADAIKPDAEEKSYLWKVLWYVIWVAAGTFVLVLFIQGFINAGDGNVSFCVVTRARYRLMPQSSSILRRLSRAPWEAG